MDENQISTPTPVVMGLLAFGANVVVGAALAWLIGATKSESGDYWTTSWASMTEQPLAGASKTFNMLILTIFIATGMVSGVIAWAAGKITAPPAEPKATGAPGRPLPAPGSPEDTAY